MRELKQLQEENARLKKLVAELSLDNAILQDVAAKNGRVHAKAAGGGLFGESPPAECAAGLSSDPAIAQHAVLPQCQRSQNVSDAYAYHNLDRLGMTTGLIYEDRDILRAGL